MKENKIIIKDKFIFYIIYISIVNLKCFFYYKNFHIGFLKKYFLNDVQ